MPCVSSETVGDAMLSAYELTPYEKGVVARWLLGELIGQANVVTEGRDAFDILIGIPHWQLKILAHFCNGSEDGKSASNETPDPHAELIEIFS